MLTSVTNISSNGPLATIFFSQINMKTYAYWLPLSFLLGEWIVCYLLQVARSFLSTRHSTCCFSVQIYYTSSWVSKYWVCCLRKAHKLLYFFSTHSAKKLKRGLWCDENVIPNSKSKQEGPDVQKLPQGGLHGYTLGRNKALVFAFWA